MQVIFEIDGIDIESISSGCTMTYLMDLTRILALGYQVPLSDVNIRFTEGD